MPIIVQKFIYRSDLRDNPYAAYVFGDNTERVGMGGQAKEMRHEPNAMGVVTKWRDGMECNDFFYDSQFKETKKLIDADFAPVVARLKMVGVVVIPLDWLGTGYSQLPKRAPNTHAYIMEWFRRLKRIESNAIQA